MIPMKYAPIPFRTGTNVAPDKGIAGRTQGFWALLSPSFSVRGVAEPSATPLPAMGRDPKAQAMASPSPLAATGFVALGGAAGAVARYQAGRLVTLLLGPAAVSAFPWATLAVNVLGSFAMGLLAGWLARHGAAGALGAEQARLFVGVGLLGGFTTFSAFSLELMLLIERGQAAQAMFYALVSVLAGLTALYLGLIVMRLAA